VEEVDLRNLSDGSFVEANSCDLVVDKGAMDVFVHANSSEEISATLNGIANVLKPTGVYIMVTNDDPSLRGDLFWENGNGKWDSAKFRSWELVGEGEGWVTNMCVARLKQ
jgi:hypothetical protein